MIKILIIQIVNLLTIIRILKISNLKKIIFTSTYYLCTLFLGILDAIGLLLVVGILFNGPILKNQDNISEYIVTFLSFIIDKESTSQLLYLVIIIFALIILLKIAIGFFDQLIWTFFRREMQIKIYYNYINSDWLKIHDFRVGDVANTLAWEVRAIAKYIQNCFQVFYSLILCIIFLLIALSTSFTIFVISGFIALPVIIFFSLIYRRLSWYSKKEAESRDIFMSDVTERLNGLFQIIAENNLIYHFKKGIKQQEKLWRLELTQGVLQTTTASFSYILILLVLISFYIYSTYSNNFDIGNISIFASIGVLGIRSLSSFNLLLSNIGNVLRLSGSMKPVIAGLSLENKRSLKIIDRKIIKIKLDNILFDFGINKKKLLENISLSVELNNPIIISGPSGSGKTTLANLISGIYLPQKGKIVYIDDKQKEYLSNDYNINVGYVTQNIHIFRGTLEEFLCEDKNIEKNKIYEVLESVGLSDFIKSKGGLDLKVIEAGRSFSGGQIRRLGIAKILLKGSQVIILDEPTSGLDKLNKEFLLNTIKKLSIDYIIIIISHDKIELENSTNVNLNDLNSE